MPLKRFYKRRRRRRYKKSFARRVKDIVFPPKHHTTEDHEFLVPNITRGQQITDDHTSGGVNCALESSSAHSKQYPQLSHGTAAGERIGDEAFIKGFLMTGYIEQPNNAFSDDRKLNPLYEYLNVWCILRRSRVATNDNAESRVRPPVAFLEARANAYPHEYHVKETLDRNMLYDTQIIFKKRVRLTRQMPSATTNETNFGSGGRPFRWYVPVNKVCHYTESNNDPLSNFFMFFIWVDNNQSNGGSTDTQWNLHYEKRIYFRDRGA